MHEVAFREACSADEIDQLQRLNYRTFAEELGQYAADGNGVLVDHFHAANRYFVAVERGQVIGMISLNASAPFSIEKRLPAGVVLGEVAARPGEVRLLAIASEARNGSVLGGLFWQVYVAAERMGCSHLLISGVEQRAAMYRSLGFRELGPAVPAGKVRFIPMALELGCGAVRERAERFRGWWERRRGRGEVRLLPGPVQISAGVERAFQKAPVSHREPEFVEMFAQTRRRLSLLAGGMDVAVMTGSGTLANDAVAACLRASFGEARGIVLSNGEFGGRLPKLARRAGLRVEEMCWGWGTAWNFEQIERALDGGAEWIWGVHLETSTGQVNDLDRLVRCCSERGVAVAADCVSSLGALPLPEDGLFLASGVSGKSLGAYAGLCFVFAGEAARGRIRGDELPATFDVVQAMGRREPMFTVPSPQLMALHRATEECYADEDAVRRRFARYARLGQMVRDELCARGIAPIARETAGAPPITSFRSLPEDTMRECFAAGFRIAHESEYLRARGWAQIGVMGDIDEAMLEPLFRLLGSAVPAEAIAG